MKTKERLIANMLTTVLALLLIAGGFGFAAGPVHADGISGPYSLTIHYEPKIGDTPVTLTEATDFSLYKVGDFGRDADTGKVVFDIDPRFGDITIENKLREDFRKKDDGTDRTDEEVEEAWTEYWMTSAKAVRNKAAELSLEADKTATMAAGTSTLTFTGLPNGLYLLDGTSVEVIDKHKTTWWYPQPMLVIILSDDQEIFTKPQADIVNRYSVTKVWNGDEAVKDLVRPEGINIKIFYGSISDNDLVEEVTLSKDNNWTYSWETKEDTDPTKWFVTEELTAEDKKNYTWNLQENTTGMTEDESRILITLTNTYDRKELEIVKTMKDYVDHSEKSNSTVVFELNGYMKDESGNESVVYHKYVSLVYDIEKEARQLVTVSDIPAGLSKLKVREVYSGNTQPAGGVYEKEAELNEAGTTYSVEFEDEYNDIIYSSGVINKYSAEKNGDDYGYKFIGREPEAITQGDGQ